MNASQHINKEGPLSSKDFASFGVDLVAYVKPVVVDGSPSYAIHAADGTPLSLAACRAAAFASIRQHEMEPVSVH
ncbi:MAG: DUF1150 family protein [Rhodospirillaceae bacterium]